MGWKESTIRMERLKTYQWYGEAEEWRCFNSDPCFNDDSEPRALRQDDTSVSLASAVASLGLAVRERGAAAFRV
jgi:hypothetical protein